MIEETARVVALEDDFARVETQRKSTRGACAVNKGYGTATLAKVLGARRTRIKVLNGSAARVGDEVVIGLEEHAIVQGSLAMYNVYDVTPELTHCFIYPHPVPPPKQGAGT